MLQTVFDHTESGEEILAYTLAQGKNTATILTLGGILQKFTVDGTDIVCGFDDYDGYRNGGGSHGVLVGRYANRIADGKFTLNGKEYDLEKNEKGITCLHGGFRGFGWRIWQAEPFSAENAEGLKLTYRSADLEGGFPGNADVIVTYTLTADALAVHYLATCDADTVFNMTNHAYFNLQGYESQSTLTHTLKIPADRYSAVDERLIPVSEQDVSGTPFDFRKAKAIGKDIGADHPQLQIGHGYDHNFYLSDHAEKKELFGRTLTEAAVLSCGERTLTCYTTKPCIQIYTGNFLGASSQIPFKGGVPQKKHGGVCLETQFAPDSPNHGEAILRRGETYDHMTVFRIEKW